MVPRTSYCYWDSEFGALIRPKFRIFKSELRWGANANINIEDRKRGGYGVLRRDLYIHMQIVIAPHQEISFDLRYGLNHY